MDANMARQLAYNSCQEEINRVLEIVKEAASDKKLEVNLDFQLSPPTEKYLSFELGFEVRGDGKSFILNKGKKYYYTIRW